MSAEALYVKAEALTQKLKLQVKRSLEKPEKNGVKALRGLGCVFSWKKEATGLHLNVEER